MKNRRSDFIRKTPQLESHSIVGVDPKLRGGPLISQGRLILMAELIPMAKKKIPRKA
jgi:hypothetical protein